MTNNELPITARAVKPLHALAVYLIIRTENYGQNQRQRVAGHGDGVPVGQ